MHAASRSGDGYKGAAGEAQQRVVIADMALVLAQLLALKGTAGMACWHLWKAKILALTWREGGSAGAAAVITGWIVLLLFACSAVVLLGAFH
jgi:hypothetical protein